MPDQELLTVALKKGSNELLLKICNGTGPGGFYFDLRSSEVSADVERVLAMDPEACDDAARAALRDAHAQYAPEFAEVRARIAAAEAERDANAGPEVPVLRELSSAARRTTRVHLRGSFLQPGDVVSPSTPKVWPPLPADAPKNRLGLARWLVSRDNPLTARVVGNRIWAE